MRISGCQCSTKASELVYKSERELGCLYTNSHQFRLRLLPVPGTGVPQHPTTGRAASSCLEKVLRQSCRDGSGRRPESLKREALRHPQVCYTTSPTPLLGRRACICILKMKKQLREVRPLTHGQTAARSDLSVMPGPATVRPVRNCWRPGESEHCRRGSS